MRRDCHRRHVFFLRSGRKRSVLTQGVIEPCPGKYPVPVRRPWCNTQGGRCFLHRQTCEETKLDQLGAGRVLACQLVQCFIDGNYLVVRSLVGNLDAVEIEAQPVSPALLPSLVASAVQEDATHGLSGGGEEMSATIPTLLLIGADQ